MIRLPGQDKLKVPVTFPAVMSKSRDYNAIEILLQSVFNYFYTESVESKNIHNPYRCKADLLPMLADYARYSYTDVKDVDKEREIIATVSELHHNKGTSTGINNALALSIVDKTTGITIPWFYDRQTNIITIILFEKLETYKMMELLTLVVPLGVKVICKPGFLVKSSEELKVYSWIEINFGYLDPDKQWYISPNNTFKVEWDEEKQLYHTYIDEQYKHDATRIGNIEITNIDSVKNADDNVKAKTEIKIPGEGEE